MKTKIKNLIGLAALCASVIHAHALPDCITNLDIVVTCGSMSVSNVSYTNYSNGGSLIGQGCTNGVALTFDCPCDSQTRPVAVVLWDCTPACGTGGSFTILMPGYSDHMVVYLEECGPCCLTWCPLAIRTCNPASKE